MNDHGWGTPGIPSCDLPDTLSTRRYRAVTLARKPCTVVTARHTTGLRGPDAESCHQSSDPLCNRRQERGTQFPGRQLPWGEGPTWRQEEPGQLQPEPDS